MKIILLANLPQSKTFHPYFEDALGRYVKSWERDFDLCFLLSVVKSNKSLLIPNSLSVALGLEVLHTIHLFMMIYLL